ncbi:MAG: hypothetical protein GF401_14750 [Chitinivibrionales bacterium]|nr:hypothetical protein [Chitinivibrionales bacterium]
MFNKNKKRSWYMRALAALLFAGFVYWVARCFLRSAAKEINASSNGRKPKNAKRMYREAMFV